MRSTQNYNAKYTKLQRVVHKTTMCSTQNYNAWYIKHNCTTITLHYKTFPFFDSYRMYIHYNVLAMYGI